MENIKVGIFGYGRGSAFVDSILACNGDVVAVCDMSEAKLQNAKNKFGDGVTTYTEFDRFIEHPMDAVILANYFNEHTPYAVKCLERDIHVLCETQSNMTMAEGVALVRAAEKSKAIFMLAENYPYMKFNIEMHEVTQSGKLGKVLFAEGEYNHPMNAADEGTIRYLRPYAEHWRNNNPRSYYLTHSLAPLMHITGATPRRVTAMPVFAVPNDDEDTALFNADRATIITCLNDDDSVFRVTGCATFGAHETSYRICGTKGQIENIRGTSDVLLRYNPWNVPEGESASDTHPAIVKDPDALLAEKAGHGGGDYYVIRDFLNSIRENKPHEFDVYFATTIASVAILAHRSVLERGVPYDIPDFRKEEDRVKYENDTLTPYYGPNGEKPTIPCCSHPDYKPSAKRLEKYERMVGSNK